MSLPRYPEYRQTTVDWLKDLPTDWAMVPLKYVIRMRSGGTPSKSNIEYWDGDVPWASSKDLKVETLSDTEDHITQHAVETGAADLVPVGSVLIVVRGMILAHTFPVTTVSSPMAINQDLKALTPNASIHARYLPWLLRGTSHETLGRIDEAGHGTKVLRLETWTSMPVPIPPHVEQLSIAAFLDRETAKIDALVAEQRRLMELLKEKRQAVISHAVTKGLNPDAPMKDSGVEWLGEVPESWHVTKMGRVFDTVGSGTTPPADEERFYDGGTIPWVNTGDLNDSEISECTRAVTGLAIDLHSALRLYSADSLVLAMYGATIGKLAIIGFPATVNQACCVFAGPRGVRPRFAFFWLLAQRQAILSLAVGGGQPNINQQIARAFPIAVPSLTEQEGILAFLDRLLRGFSELMREAELTVSLLLERRTALISAAVTGQIDVRGLSSDAVA